MCHPFALNHLSTQARLQQFAEPSTYVQDKIFLFQAVGTDGSGIVATVTWIDHDLADFQAEGTDQRTVSGFRGFSLVDGEVRGSPI